MTPRPCIFYVGPLWKGGTCLQRMQALEELGCRIVPFDITPYERAGGRLRRSLAYRFAWGPSIRQLNRDLARQTAARGCDWIWVDKGTWIYRQTLESLQVATHARLIHYTPDPAILFHRTRHFVGAIPTYDVLITSKGWEVPHYEAHGARRVVLLPQGFDREIFRPQPVAGPSRAALQSQVCFVGHYETHYYARVRAAGRVVAPPNLAVWGRWQRHIPLHPWLRRVVRGPGIWAENYARALCSAEIGLGLVSKWIPETSTTRTFEIPACGTFLLAERTAEHQAFFVEGREAEFFDSDDELRDKLRFYLAHPAERRRVAAAGRRRCLDGGYSNYDRMRQALEVL